MISIIIKGLVAYAKMRMINLPSNDLLDENENLIVSFKSFNLRLSKKGF